MKLKEQKVKTQTLKAKNLLEKFASKEKLQASSASKVSLNGKVAFGLLSHVTCPGKTDFCSSCYVPRAARYKGVWTVLASNTRIVLDHVKNKDVNGLSTKLTEMVEMSDAYKHGIFRIHWSGDFMSQVYLDAWKKTIIDVDDINFWAYTRSFNLDFSDLPENVVIYASVDDFNKEKATATALRFNMPIAYTGNDDGLVDFFCPHDTKQVEDCASCEHCIIAGKNVRFRIR